MSDNVTTKPETSPDYKSNKQCDCNDCKGNDQRLYSKADMIALIKYIHENHGIDHYYDNESIYNEFIKDRR